MSKITMEQLRQAVKVQRYYESISNRPNGTKEVKIMFHDANGIAFDDPKLATKQEFLEEANINNIVQRFRKTGVLPQPVVNGSYGDFSQVTNFQDAQIKIQEAYEMFDALPAKTRAAFEHDPALLLEAVDDPRQHAKLIELGLLEKGFGGTTTPVSEEVKPAEQ